MLADEVQRVLQLVGSVQGEQLDALEVALGDPGQGAGRRHLQQPGHAEVGHRRQAEVPADRRGDLADQPAQHLAAVVDDLAVGVGEQPGARVVGGDGPGQAGQVGHRRLHVHGVERAGDAERDQPGAGRAVRRRRRPAARWCRRRRSGRCRCCWPRSGPCASSAASTSSGLPPMTRGHRGRAWRHWPRPSPGPARGRTPSPVRPTAHRRRRRR